MTSPSFKIAIRDEGDFVVAYFSAPRMYADPEQPPLVLATFRKNMLQLTPAAFEGWQAVLRQAMAGVLKAGGIDVDGWRTHPGPPDERTGKA